MSIEGKHSYRFGFLKSEEWELVRTEALARDDAKCRLCGVRSISNDGHHIMYRIRWKDTRVSDLITLCRGCHDIIHVLTKPKRESKNEDTDKTLAAAKKEFGVACEMVVRVETLFRAAENFARNQTQQHVWRATAIELKKAKGVAKNLKKAADRLANPDDFCCSFCLTKSPEQSVDVFARCKIAVNPGWLLPLCNKCTQEINSMSFASVRDARNYTFLGFKRRNKMRKELLTETIECLSASIGQDQSRDCSQL